MPIKVRVRGIYSTAISKILNDRGIHLVDVSDVIAERLKIDRRRGEYADVTVKSDESNSSQVLVLGFPRETVEVCNILAESIPDVVVYKPKLGLYATFKARVKGLEKRGCIAETPLGEAPLVDVDSCNEGSEVGVTLIKVPIHEGERPLVSGRIRVVGRYAILGRGSRISFSSFIRNKERISELLNLSAKYVREGFSIKWRSNADEAPLEKVMEEIPYLIKKLEEVEKKLDASKPLEIVYEGEYIRLLELTYTSKRYLDEVRNKVLPTAPYHHVFRCNQDLLDSTVELIDTIAEYVDRGELLKWLRKWLVKRFANRKDVKLIHRRILKRNIMLGKVKIAKVVSENPLKLILRREVRSSGTYDGLRVPKEPGDIILTEISEDSWYLIHRYYSKDGSLKGVYVNINTPPEFLPNGDINYLDLNVDMIKDEGGCTLIDTPEFRKLIANELLTPWFLEKIISRINEVITSVCRSDFKDELPLDESAE